MTAQELSAQTVAELLHQQETEDQQKGVADLLQRTLEETFDPLEQDHFSAETLEISDADELLSWLQETTGLDAGELTVQAAETSSSTPSGQDVYGQQYSISLRSQRTGQVSRILVARPGWSQYEQGNRLTQEVSQEQQKTVITQQEIIAALSVENISATDLQEIAREKVDQLDASTTFLGTLSELRTMLSKTFSPDIMQRLILTGRSESTNTGEQCTLSVRVREAVGAESPAFMTVKAEYGSGTDPERATYALDTQELLGRLIRLGKERKNGPTIVGKTAQEVKAQLEMMHIWSDLPVQEIPGGSLLVRESEETLIFEYSSQYGKEKTVYSVPKDAQTGNYTCNWQDLEAGVRARISELTSSS
ncbi:hypothetical protein LRY65_03525 [Candidatus Woesebacteria bacterium]|nr:hypothetical protein [Candidatus Woesebacteria bacterium]MCD8506964.1 hypothetical protein [Candidatus Woesebacteria bacterium]MCD8527255.1 hypothetical protein [Candidatus Woesebacteria bacterium]MCD8546622.1 hypothetical protein [Candidatus Woesebacteria bacterium]